MGGTSTDEPNGDSLRAFAADLYEAMDVTAHITGTIWKINVELGDEVGEGDEVLILESMKMEMPLEAESGGTVDEIKCAEGDSVNEGDTLLVLKGH